MIKRRVYIIFFLLLVLSAFLVHTFSPKSVKRKDVEIDYGLSSIKIAVKLYREGLIRNPLSFLSLHLLFKKKLEAGEYEFDGTVFPWDVYFKIARGEKKLYRITIPEGSDLYDIANTLQEHGVCSKEDFLKHANSPETAKRYGLNVHTMEGFLFPDTYFFSKKTHPVKVIDVMHKNFIKRTQKLREELQQKGLTLEKWVTLASMIEKETAIKEERFLVSAVIHNRIKKGMKLDIDPTVIYALKRKDKWKGVLTRKHLLIDDPYNTYMYKGLPPSPICNPGLDSLEAALKPAEVDYLFFVATGDGGHAFSSNYTKHADNVRWYRGKR